MGKEAKDREKEDMEEGEEEEGKQREYLEVDRNFQEGIRVQDNLEREGCTEAVH